MNQPTIKFKKLHPDAVIPHKATDFSGGYDVVATEAITDERMVTYKLGFALEIPEGYRLILVPRSSITKTDWIMQNSPGLGDADYRGEYQMKFTCLPPLEEHPYRVGDRVGQIYLEKVIEMDFQLVDTLEDSKRGSGGFGSTGK